MKRELLREEKDLTPMQIAVLNAYVKTTERRIEEQSKMFPSVQDGSISTEDLEKLVHTMEHSSDFMLNYAHSWHNAIYDSCKEIRDYIVDTRKWYTKQIKDLKKILERRKEKATA